MIYKIYTMSGPWYECSGPSLKDANKAFNNYEINGVVVSNVIVKKCIQDEYDKHGGFGSWRGWATFGKSRISKDIVEKYNSRQKRLDDLRNCLVDSSIFMNYVYDRLYRPGGLRSNDVKYNS